MLRATLALLCLSACAAAADVTFATPERARLGHTGNMTEFSITVPTTNAGTNKHQVTLWVAAVDAKGAELGKWMLTDIVAPGKATIADKVTLTSAEYSQVSRLVLADSKVR